MWFESNLLLPNEFISLTNRIHASILTYIEKHDYTVEMEQLLLGFVQRADECPFMIAKRRRLEQAAEAKRKKPSDKVRILNTSIVPQY